MSSAVRTPTAHTVLVVEDEAGLRFIASDCLGYDCGFAVVQAASADEAVGILKENADIRCVFTDVRMPGQLDGIALTHHVLETYPGLPILMTSGNLPSAERIDGVPFMAKPYDILEVCDAIRGLIDRPHQ